MAKSKQEVKDENQDIIDIYEMDKTKMKKLVEETTKVLPYVNMNKEYFKKYAVLCKDFSTDDVIILKTRYTNDSCAVDVNLVGEVTDLISDEKEIHLEYFPILTINNNANIACPNMKTVYLPETLKSVSAKFGDVEIVFCGIVTPKWLTDNYKNVSNMINPYYSGEDASYEDTLAEFELVDESNRLSAENISMLGDMMSKLSGAKEEEVYRYYLDTFIGYYGYKYFNSVLETQFKMKEYTKEDLRTLALKSDKEIDNQITKLQYSEL